MPARSWLIEDVSETGLEKLGAWLSIILKKSDVLLLQGDLGAGKTTFARALIRHLSEHQIDEIPSPTFSLVQHYQTARVEIFHFDLYRLSGADEVHEIGLDDALIHGVTLIEWPDRLATPPGPDYLEIEFAETTTPDERQLTLKGHGDWSPRLKRLERMIRFVEKSNRASSMPLYMQGDASTRAYARLPDDAHPAIFMNAPAQADGPPMREGKPYSQIAHLAEDVRAFVAVDLWLAEAGFGAPEIYAHDLDDGFLILEDMGNKVFGHEIAAGRAIEELYRPAVDLLVEMRQHNVPDELPIPNAPSYALPQFDQAAFLIEAELLIDWYWPAANEETIPDLKRQEFISLYQNLYARLKGQDFGWMLRDYHSPNLIWLQKDTSSESLKAKGFKHVGIIDFQDALRGPRSYDLVSLLQDARLDVSEELEKELLNHYCARSCAQAHAQAQARDATSNEAVFNEEEFRLSYAILGAQRNTKILGIFARLAIRDKKPAYLQHMPRIWQYLERNLQHPDLVELKKWFDANLPKEIRDRSINVEQNE